MIPKHQEKNFDLPPDAMPNLSSSRVDSSVPVKELVLSIDESTPVKIQRRKVGGSYLHINRLVADSKRRTRMTDQSLQLRTDGLSTSRLAGQPNGQGVLQKSRSQMIVNART